MTVIAWDGKTFAADRQAQNMDVKMEMTKIFVSKNRDMVVGISGFADQVTALRDWVFSGMNPKKYPTFARKEDGSIASIIKRENGAFKIYRVEAEPYPILIEDKIYAAGSGRDVALGAMAAGVSAIRAVEIASKYVTSVGMGIDAYKWCDTFLDTMDIIPHLISTDFLKGDAKFTPGFYAKQKHKEPEEFDHWSR